MIVKLVVARITQAPVLHQTVEYLDALRQLYPSRTVKGLIITGREDQVSATLIKGVVGYDIEWFCYDVSFTRLLPSS